jgi:putative ABC transport system substrate-binding protein
MTIARVALAAALVFGIALVTPEVAAQPAGKVARIGYLGSGSPASGFHDALLAGLRDLGWVEGQNFVVDYRFAEGRFERLPGLATELARSNVDLIVAQPTPAALAARDATRTIPIVMVNVGDPVGVGLVASLSRPGGNVTGTAFDVGLETFSKALQLLKEAVPGTRRVAVLTNPANPAQALAISNIKAAARSLGLRLLFVDVRDPDELAGAFARIAKDRADAVFVVAESLFLANRARLAELALAHALPSMFGARQNVDAGGLVSYGPSLTHTSRRAATFVDKILKGAKPGELPVEQPTKFELVVNLKTAKTLGLAVPRSVLLRADAIIE